MADNTVINPASVGGGDTISTDDLGSVKVQRVKIQTGADGSATDVSTANPVPAAGPEAHDAAAASAPVRVAGKYSSSPAKVSATGDVVDLAVTQDGKLLDIHSTAAADTTNVNTNYTSAQTNAVLVSAPGASKRLVIVDILYSRDTAGTMKLVEDTAGTPTAKCGPHYFSNNDGISHPKTYIPLSTNKNLGITTVGGGNETITLRVITENV
jgi:hypothetical protein